jgi:hypothetical protein
LKIEDLEAVFDATIKKRRWLIKKSSHQLKEELKKRNGRKSGGLKKSLRITSIISAMSDR